MASGPMSVDSSALDPPTLPDTAADGPKYGGFSRFELELEVCAFSPFAPGAELLTSSSWSSR